MKTILMMAITADGKIAKHATQLADWTSKADKKIFVEETKSAGVIIMGKTTYETIGRPLPGRLNVVLDQTPDTSKNIPGSLEYTNLPPKSILADLAKRGFKTAILGGGATINGLFLKANLIGEIWLTIEPKIFGEGLSLFKDADVNLELELIEVRNLDKNVIQVRYKVVK
ncbi:MAG TPA: dihydrofolate reductase family protein [Patescibacteria group bacterium]|nr:dihydrofolate reductase family protein [Patescibacteria group bacterium]